MGNEGGVYACYLGREYRLAKLENTFFLISENPHDESSGFVPYDQGIYTKGVSRNEMENAYDVDTYCMYKGHTFYVEQETDGAIYIHTSDGSLQATHQLEMSEPFSYEKWVPQDEVDAIWEERKPVYGLPFLTDPIVKIK